MAGLKGHLKIKDFVRKCPFDFTFSIENKGVLFFFLFFSAHWMAEHTWCTCSHRCRPTTAWRLLCGRHQLASHYTGLCYVPLSHSGSNRSSLRNTFCRTSWTNQLGVVNKILISNSRTYLQCSLGTLYLYSHARLVTVGDSVLCCCDPCYMCVDCQARSVPFVPWIEKSRNRGNE